MQEQTRQYKICSRCVSDTTIPSIRFDENGVCNFCKSHDLLLTYYPQNPILQRNNLDTLVTKIKKSGKNNKYDCIIGVSGGTDSTYTLYLARKLGLRPLAVHFDNGWNTEIAVKNIKNALKILDVDLYTFVVDWEEFRSIQKSFLLASVPDIEVPTDVAIHGTLYRAAKKENVKYILGGQSFVTEGTVPIEWSYIDGKFVKSVHKEFGNGFLKSYPNATIYQIFYFTFIRGIKQIPFLNYVNYNKSDARNILEKELNWQYYGGHHYENFYSHFAFGWYSTKKFNIDKRKISLSGPLRMGYISREDALKELSEVPPTKPDIVDYTLKKLGISTEEFETILSNPNKSFHNYITSFNTLQRFKFIVKFAVWLKIITPVLYEKYFK